MKASFGVTGAIGAMRALLPTITVRRTDEEGNFKVSVAQELKWGTAHLWKGLTTHVLTTHATPHQHV